MNCSVSSVLHPVHVWPVCSRREFLQRLGVGTVALAAGGARPADAAPDAVAGAGRVEHPTVLADPTYYTDPGWSA